MVTNAVVATGLISASVVFGYVRYRVAQVRTVAIPSLTPVLRPVRKGAAAAAPSASPPMNILLVGSNTRTGLSPSEARQFGSPSEVPGARSDVTMVLHLDPATGSASLLSIPRDLFVLLPPHSMAGQVGKIDGALNDGPNNLVAAVTGDLGIPINHFVEVNFDGFQRTIDAIGGVSMNFPDPVRDPMTGLNIRQTGCVHLNGATALAVVRARELQYFAHGRWNNDPQSDLSRIRRDHTFLKIFVNTAKAEATNPLRLNGLLGGLLNQVTVDSGLNLNTMLELFRSFRHLNPDTVPETTLPITQAGNYHYAGGVYGDVDLPVEPLDHQVISAWAGQPGPVVAPSSLTLRLVNISGTFRKADEIGAQLAGLGYHVAGTVIGATPASPTETVIRYHPGSIGQALAVLHSLSGAVTMHPDPTVADGSITLDVGSLVAVPANPGAASTAPTTSVAPTATTTPAGTTTTIPTLGGQVPSPSVDRPAPFDPTAC